MLTAEFTSQPIEVRSFDYETLQHSRFYLPAAVLKKMIQKKMRLDGR